MVTRAARLGRPGGGRDRALGHPPAAPTGGDADRLAADQPRRTRGQRRRPRPRLARLRGRRAAAASSTTSIGFDPARRGRVDRGDAAATPPTWTPTSSTSPRTRAGPMAGPTSCSQRHRDFAEACEANSDGILPFITTENAARDMDLLRAVLGDRELNYLGYSYGTFLGATYAKLYPERVGRLVLDGAIDPAVSGARCQHDPGDRLRVGAARLHGRLPRRQRLPVPRHGRRGDGRPRHAARERRPQSRCRRPDGRMLGADSLHDRRSSPRCTPQESWQYLTIALERRARRATPSRLPARRLLLQPRGRRVPRQLRPRRSAPTTAWTTRVDVTDEEQAAAEALLAEKAPDRRAVLVGTRPVRGLAVPADRRARARSRPRAPRRSWSSARRTIRRRRTSGRCRSPTSSSSGVLITRVGEGHTGYNKGNACVDAAVEAYLLEGTVPEDGLRCE